MTRKRKDVMIYTCFVLPRNGVGYRRKFSSSEINKMASSEELIMDAITLAHCMDDILLGMGLRLKISDDEWENHAHTLWALVGLSYEEDPDFGNSDEPWVGSESDSESIGPDGVLGITLGSQDSSE